MTTRREFEQALTGRSSRELNDFFESLGYGRVTPGGATTEEERRQGILNYQLDLADRRPDRFTKICRELGLPTPQEKLLAGNAREFAENRRDRAIVWIRDHILAATIVGLIVAVLLAWLGLS